MDISLVYTDEEKQAFEEEHAARVLREKKAAEEKAMDPKAFEALFHKE